MNGLFRRAVALLCGVAFVLGAATGPAWADQFPSTGWVDAASINTAFTIDEASVSHSAVGKIQIRGGFNSSTGPQYAWFRLTGVNTSGTRHKMVFEIANSSGNVIARHDRWATNPTSASLTRQIGYNQTWRGCISTSDITRCSDSRVSQTISVRS